MSANDEILYNAIFSSVVISDKGSQEVVNRIFVELEMPADIDLRSRQNVGFSRLSGLRNMGILSDDYMEFIKGILPEDVAIWQVLGELNG